MSVQRERLRDWSEAQSFRPVQMVTTTRTQGTFGNASENVRKFYDQLENRNRHRILMSETAYLVWKTRNETTTR